MRPSGVPEGDTYDWFRRASELLERGDAGASLTLIERVLVEEPGSPSALEIRARALFDGGHFAEAADAFAVCLEVRPDDDFAHYGAGMSLWRLQRFPESRDHLAMACVMRPDRADYARALTQVRATLAARKEAGLPLSGPVEPPGTRELSDQAHTAGRGGGNPTPSDESPRPITDFWSDPQTGADT